MRCRNPDSCGCLCHVTPATHVPVCPRHSVPLERSELEPGRGLCADCYRRGAHAHYPPWLWAWAPRDNFAIEDLPPWNGQLPPELSGVEDADQ